MKKQIMISLLLLTTIILTGCTIDTNTQEIPEQTIESYENEIEDYYTTKTLTDETNVFGSTGALDDEEFTLEEMLIYAIQDEYAARAEYDYILNTFDITKPFSNIIKAEETHITLLLPLFETYGFVLPEDTSSDHLISIDSVQEAFDTGVQAEILNISMYNLFLEQEDLPQEVVDVFIKLRDASLNHLQAFEKNAS